ncbi:hypothetical protein BCCR75501_00784 [Burkholderia sola]|nr:hypothetical protein BCCR75389_00781 [Burkholderia cenocepacia]CAG2277572.1 hypothetical protein BCCR75390_00781 [Burkholderia cenocepacia]CAG2277739.1 hypothetical protein BCCR75587_00784 [Burkholderia cenocepacia]CAG2277790.1 hypothetical protein BCCR75592_00794 [Burkholderia cenocepacia]CAG2277900.1 hypothetical protein BCCR75501_00784 [Burkholderia cenocepacia]
MKLGLLQMNNYPILDYGPRFTFSKMPFNWYSRNMIPTRLQNASNLGKCHFRGGDVFQDILSDDEIK